MFDFFRENPVGTLFAFCVLMITIYQVIKLFIDRHKPIVECECEQCDCGCHDEDEDEDDEEEESV
jgi:hypothetical protein